jgi:hypothetical protein
MLGLNIVSGTYTGKVNVFNLDTCKKETNIQVDTKVKFTISVSNVRKH